jgi:ribosome-associated translation inhibitor RaiA
MSFIEFPIEFQSDVPNISPEIRGEVEKRLLELAGDHTGMIGAAIALTQPAQTGTPFIFQARIVVYHRPEDIVAVKQADTVEGALKFAMDAIERQVREQRKKRGELWKRPALKDAAREENQT